MCAVNRYNPYAWEKQNTANWPWHPSGAALEALALLNCASACTPRYAMAADGAILDDPTQWEAFMDVNVANNTNIWGGSQQGGTTVRLLAPPSHPPLRMLHTVHGTMVSDVNARQQKQRATVSRGH